MIKKCCDCKRIKINDHWLIASLINKQPIVTHGYCPHCYRELMRRLHLYSGRLNGFGLLPRELETVQ